MGTVRISEYNTSPSTTFEVEGDLLSQSTAGNYSTIRCYLVAKNGPGGSTGSYFAGAGSQSGTIAGVKTFATKSASSNFLPSGYSNGATRWRLGPYDVKVPHDSDGTHEPIRFGMVLNYGPHDETLFSSPMSLPTIARASASTLPSTVTLDTTVTINTNRASSAFTHTLQLVDNGSSILTIATGVGASSSWKPALSLATRFPNAASKKFTLRTITYSGGTKIGQHDRVFTLAAPSSLTPTISSINVVDQNPDVQSIVGLPVQGLSRVKFTVNAAGVQGSTIKSRTVTFQGASRPAGDEVAVTQSGSLGITGKVTDSRGRTATASGSVDVLSYSAPQVTAYQARRCTSSGVLADDGEYLRIDLTGAVASLVNSTQRNSLSIKVLTRPRMTPGGTPTFWTTRNSFTHSSLSYNSSLLVSGGGVFPVTESFDVRVELSDKFSVYLADTVVSTASVALDMNGTNVGVGKIWEQGALDVAGEIYSFGKRVLTRASETGWVSSGLSITTHSDFTLEAYRLRIDPTGRATGMVRVRYQGATITANSAGNIADINGVVTMPPGWRNFTGNNIPAPVVQTGVATWWGRANASSGDIDLTHGSFPGQILTATTLLEIHIDYYAQYVPV